MTRHPGRPSAFAAVSLQRPKAAIDEMNRTMGSRGFVWVMVNGYTNIGPDEEAPLDDFWAEAKRLSAPVYLHPREPLPSQTRSIRGYPELGALPGPSPTKLRPTPFASYSAVCSTATQKSRLSSVTWAKGCRSCSPACSIASTSNATA